MRHDSRALLRNSKLTDLENDQPTRRRDFFRDGLARLIGPMAEFLEQRIPGLAPPARILRPPGAIQESLFADTCRRCGACVEVCPAAVFVLQKNKAVAKTIDECVECCACIDICPKDAIKNDAC